MMTEGGGSDVGGCSTGGGGGGYKRSSSSLPEEMERIHKSNPPPFLTKIYNIVEDKETDSVVCWSPCGTGFIILDHHRFAIEILPKYFRHKNFSSFIYQLNNYGFRKISENWEYWNGWFQAGKKHLLKNIKRRKEKAQVKENSEKLCLEAELKELTNHHNRLKVDLGKLEEKLENAEKITSKYQKMVISMINAFYASSSQQFVQKLKETKEVEDNDQSLKRRRIDLNEPQSNTEETTDITCTVQTSSENMIGGDQYEEANAEEGKDNAIIGRQIPDSGSERFKDMEEVLMCEEDDDGEGEMVMYRSEIDKEYWETLLKNEDPYANLSS